MTGKYEVAVPEARATAKLPAPAAFVTGSPERIWGTTVAVATS